jgi:hypothetical protein
VGRKDDSTRQVNKKHVSMSATFLIQTCSCTPPVISSQFTSVALSLCSRSSKKAQIIISRRSLILTHQRRVPHHIQTFPVCDCIIPSSTPYPVPCKCLSEPTAQPRLLRQPMRKTVVGDLDGARLGSESVYIFKWKYARDIHCRTIRRSCCRRWRQRRTWGKTGHGS